MTKNQNPYDNGACLGPRWMMLKYLPENEPLEALMKYMLYAYFGKHPDIDGEKERGGCILFLLGTNVGQRGVGI